jgi:hypothetical protein
LATWDGRSRDLVSDGNFLGSWDAPLNDGFGMNPNRLSYEIAVRLGHVGLPGPGRPPRAGQKGTDRETAGRAQMDSILERCPALVEVRRSLKSDAGADQG